MMSGMGRCVCRDRTVGTGRASARRPSSGSAPRTYVLGKSVRAASLACAAADTLGATASQPASPGQCWYRWCARICGTRLPDQASADRPTGGTSRPRFRGLSRVARCAQDRLEHCPGETSGGAGPLMRAGAREGAPTSRQGWRRRRRPSSRRDRPDPRPATRRFVTRSRQRDSAGRARGPDPAVNRSVREVRPPAGGGLSRRRRSAR